MGRGPMADKILQELRCLLGQLEQYGGESGPGTPPPLGLSPLRPVPSTGRPFPLALLGWAPSNITFELLFGERFDYQDPVFVTLLSLIDEVMVLLGTPSLQVRGRCSWASGWGQGAECQPETCGRGPRADSQPGEVSAAGSKGLPPVLFPHQLAVPPRPVPQAVWEGRPLGQGSSLPLPTPSHQQEVPGLRSGGGPEAAGPQPPARGDPAQPFSPGTRHPLALGMPWSCALPFQTWGAHACRCQRRF